ncbi:0393c4d8-d7af-4f58-aa68-537893771d0a [Sclerotinia trifoliorum]|uniref:0393c4d8-d7af-4f58-aa68-537893771d0a n=1 Tax=Sclerotinia trifoliorum TaxID=28548 RepID=A0A8H2W4W1_9HELO|nr:0393c4d8-d7af-4f58-aa68-537893771d0a [Sclerotinia trifoliorum]
MAGDIERASPKFQKLPWLLEYRSSDWFILTTVCCAIFTDAFLYGVVVPVLPFSLQERSGVPEEEVQWWTSFIFAIFGAAIIIGSPICGWLADHTTDRSITYFVGLFILAAATLLFGLAKKAWLLVVSRMFQGFSAAIVYTVGLALLVDTVGSENIGQWMGTALSCSSVGLIISPLLGGIVYDKAGYMAVFSMAASLIVIDVLLRMLMIEKRTAERYRNVHTSPAEREVQTNGSESINSWSEPSDTPNPTPPGFGIPNYDESSALLPKKIQNSNPASRAWTLPPVITLLGSPRVCAAIYGIFVNVSILATFDSVLGLFVKETFHWSSLAAGLIFLCLAVPGLAGPLVGTLSDNLGPRWIAVVGCTLTAVPLILLRLVDNDTTEQKILLCVLLSICGCTLILIVAPVAADLSLVVGEIGIENPGKFGPGGAYAQAYALFNCSMAAATIFGPVFAGALITQYGWKTMGLAMGIFSLTGAIPCLFFTGGRLFRKESKSATVNLG